jgi:hypothetical protein
VLVGEAQQSLPRTVMVARSNLHKTQDMQRLRKMPLVKACLT